MLKPLDQLAVGDWVVTDSLITSRFISAPYKVVKLAASRVYVERYRVDPVTKALEVSDERYFQRKRILYVFADEAGALAASDWARTASDEHERQVRELQAAHKAAFEAYMASLPRQPAVS